MKSTAELRLESSWQLFIATVAGFLFIIITLLYVSKIPSILSQLALLPILWAAVLFEWRGGLTAAITIAIIMSVDSKTAYPVPSFSLYILFGIICSALADLRKRRIQNAELQAIHLHNMNTKILRGLASTLDIRDHHTQNHSERVAKNALALGRAIGLQESQLDTLYWSGLLHDLGKMAIPEVILLKPTQLNAQEYAEVKRHPVYGAELLSSVAPEFRDIAAAVRHHHERWDGQGYPKGLSRGDIPLLSRIISISDVFEALTSQRPYRQPLLPQQALEYLKQKSGTHFDPQLILSFERCFERGLIHCSSKIESFQTLHIPYAKPNVMERESITK
jgi:HD-GYP domain-containing protein (c-di-GMP phosphodiesterase class II)